ncbi:hypothetical protein RDI58_006034 [Solanum bulbocastanum]|uniref:Uncharacterized protein n=1 Tax=Solanum bulbocastanum TaxID=147425 RepID=A0AAN8UA57_SOLBU
MLSSRVDGDSHKWIDAGNRETRAVWRLHHSAEAICSELPQLSSHQCDAYTLEQLFPKFSDRWLHELD